MERETYVGKQALGTVRLFQPDILVQYTMNRKPDKPDPEKVLLLAVLGNGLKSYQENLFPKSQKGQEEFDEADEWIRSNDTKYFYSFANVCGFLNLDPGYIRKRLENWRVGKIKAALVCKERSRRYS